ncbi:MAG: hypothetical protein RBT57_12925 [Paludibacter sp.]|jgi:hypothetical protein|nr:hypothetical protein [Paludibacter sp.]
MSIIDTTNIKTYLKEKLDTISHPNHASQHTFHIPVMGLAYTVDAPVKVARYGISSVISIIEDRLLEMMRAHYYPTINQPYVPISNQEHDYRAKRVTDYLNLVNTIVHKQMEKLREEAFEVSNDIAKYFEMLPNDSILKNMYLDMINCPNQMEKAEKQAFLRSQLKPGRIDVNIMTKLDGEVYDKVGKPVVDGSNAVTALRGYINSNLSNSGIVFSAGLNPRLYNYLDTTDVFNPDANGQFTKKVIVKVSDYRSALIQGKYLAKKGIWVSEFRIESGLNCGGHAFATTGYLLGPVLEEFKQNWQELIDSIFEMYQPVIVAKTGINITQAPATAITVQGGIGTYEEDTFLRTHYNLNGTGWGTPFLLVPEATTVDDHTLQLLSKATGDDVFISNYSPLGVPFYYLEGTTGDLQKHQFIADGKPGSSCPEKYLQFNTEFTDKPICAASKQYQSLKLAQLSTLGLSEEELEERTSNVLAKDCLCVGLSNAATLRYDGTFLKNNKAVNICPGPNIANFSKIISLPTMTDHIYGRTNLVTNPNRPHVFITEMGIYFTFLKKELSQGDAGDKKRKIYYELFLKNLSEAIEYYQNLHDTGLITNKGFTEALVEYGKEIGVIKQQYSLN